MADFLSSVVPIKMETSKQLISADIRSNTQTYKVCYFTLLSIFTMAIWDTCCYVVICKLETNPIVYLFHRNCTNLQGRYGVLAKSYCKEFGGYQVWPILHFYLSLFYSLWMYGLVAIHYQFHNPLTTKPPRPLLTYWKYNPFHWPCYSSRRWNS